MSSQSSQGKSIAAALVGTLVGTVIGASSVHYASLVAFSDPEAAKLVPDIRSYTERPQKRSLRETTQSAENREAEIRDARLVEQTMHQEKDMHGAADVEHKVYSPEEAVEFCLAKGFSSARRLTKCIGDLQAGHKDRDLTQMETVYDDCADDTTAAYCN